MKTYPSITKDIRDDIHIYAFDKLDGNNIRAEWTLISNICYHAPWLNISKYGEPIPELFDVKKFLVFS